ncbi:MAG: helix-turn-helix domain-containing protein [Candidatus Bathyarchaeota archaeon]|nr:helix-turn-helix domain-containing protein [Candidatus Bathyarchaeota archaeon]
MNLANAPTVHNSPFMDTRQAATYLGGLSPRTLEKYRLTGEGPVFYKITSRCFYKREDLDEWAESRRRVSTSDVG